MKNKGCLHCTHSRRAIAAGMIACAYAFSKHCMDYQAIMDDLELDDLSSGWGCMKQAPLDLGGGVTGAGVMIHGVPVFSQTFSCKYFSPK